MIFAGIEVNGKVMGIFLDILTSGGGDLYVLCWEILNAI